MLATLHRQHLFCMIGLVIFKGGQTFLDHTLLLVWNHYTWILNSRAIIGRRWQPHICYVARRLVPLGAAWEVGPTPSTHGTHRRSRIVRCCMIDTLFSTDAENALYQWPSILLASLSKWVFAEWEASFARPKTFVHVVGWVRAQSSTIVRR